MRYRSARTQAANEGSGFCSKRRSQAATACVKYPASLRRRISGGSPISRWRKSSQQTSTEQPTGPSSITFPSEGNTLTTAIPKLQVTRTLEAHCSEIKKKAPIKEPSTPINGTSKNEFSPVTLWRVNEGGPVHPKLFPLRDFWQSQVSAREKRRVNGASDGKVKPLLTPC